jgi:NAD(P)-dependent dehydrogenase (short-subunit alcohol dehydrogenase family)
MTTTKAGLTVVHERDDVLRYSGRRCIVTGAASALGTATARILIDLGAEVHAVDGRKPEVVGLASASETDLTDATAIRRTIASIGAVVNNLFSCVAPAADASGLDVMVTSFCGLRELTEQVVPLMIDSAAIVSVARVAAGDRQSAQETLAALVATPDFNAAQQWCGAHPDELVDARGLAAGAIAVYTEQRSVELLGQGIRINCGAVDATRGRSTPEAQAWPLVFLGSRRADAVTGVTLRA